MEKDIMEDTAGARAGQADTDDDDASGTPLAPGTAEPATATAPGAEVETGPDGQPVGADNIRDGTVRGLMGGPNQTQGEGQGG